MVNLSKIGLILVLTSPLFAQQAYNVRCDVGGQNIVTIGIVSVTKVEASYPGCSVTVFVHGTPTLASLTDDNGIPISNPFQTSLVTGYGLFRPTVNGKFDVVLSGAGMPNPITIGDILFNDPASANTFSSNNVFNGNDTFNGSNTFTGQVFTKYLEGVRYADQFSSLQAAITEATSTGPGGVPNSEIILPCGTYPVGATITLTSGLAPTRAIRLSGVNKDCVILQATADNFTMMVQATDTELDHMTFDANGHTGVVCLSTRTNLTLRQARFIGCQKAIDMEGSISGAFGVFFMKAYGIYINGTNGSGPVGQYGVYQFTAGQPGVTWVNENDFYGLQVINTSVAGVYANGASDWYISGLDVEGNTGYGFDLESGQGIEIANGDCEGNTKGNFLQPAPTGGGSFLQGAVIRCNSIDAWARPTFATIGTTSAGSPTVTMTNTATMSPGKNIIIAGAGASFYTVISVVTNTSINVSPSPTNTVVGAALYGPFLPSGTGGFRFESEINTYTYSGYNIGPNIVGQAVLFPTPGATNAVWVCDTTLGDWFLEDQGGNVIVHYNCSTDLASFDSGISIGAHVLNTGTGHKHKRTGVNCTTAAAIGATCTTGDISWPGPAFVDISYTLACTFSSTVTNVPTIVTTTKAAGTFTLTIAALTAAAATYSEVDCIADHD